MSNGKLTLSNGVVVDSVRAIDITISLGILFKDHPRELLMLAHFCRFAKTTAIPIGTADIRTLTKLGLCDENGVFDDEVRNVVICTVKGDDHDTLQLVSPTSKPS